MLGGERRGVAGKRHADTEATSTSDPRTHFAPRRSTVATASGVITRTALRGDDYASTFRAARRPAGARRAGNHGIPVQLHIYTYSTGLSVHHS